MINFTNFQNFQFCYLEFKLNFYSLNYYLNLILQISAIMGQIECIVDYFNFKFQVNKMVHFINNLIFTNYLNFSSFFVVLIQINCPLKLFIFQTIKVDYLLILKKMVFNVHSLPTFFISMLTKKVHYHKFYQIF